MRACVRASIHQVPDQSLYIKYVLYQTPDRPPRGAAIHIVDARNQNIVDAKRNASDACRRRARPVRVLNRSFCPKPKPVLTSNNNDDDHNKIKN